MDPTRFEVTDIYKTSVCPLAKVMRTECRKRKIKHLKVVYSKEPAMTPIEDDSISCKHHCICPPGTQRKCTERRAVPGSNAFVPSVAGLIIGGEVVKDLVGFVPMKGRQGGVFRLPPPYLWTLPTPKRAKGCSPLTILKKKSKHKKASAAPVGAIALTLFSLLHP